MICRPLILLLVLAGTLTVRGELQLKGIMFSDGQPLFSIYSTEDQTSKWVRIGQSFAEFTAIEFDAVSDTLMVQNGNVRRSLKLQSSTIKVSSEDRRAMLITQQDAVAKELVALSARLVTLQSTKAELLRVQRSDPKVEEELATLVNRRAELDGAARAIDRSLLGQADTSFVQKLVPPPAPSQK
jgi:hypothetical protein